MAYIAANTSLIALDEGIGGGPKARRFFVTRRRATRASNPLEERIVALVEPLATDLGYRLVRVRVSGNRRKRLQIMAERLSDGEMNVDDCGRLSRAVSSVFDLEDPLPDEYDLEVSSPGIDRPLMRAEDFARFVGHEAKVEALGMSDGRKRFKGVIAGVEGDEIRLALAEGGEQTFKISALSDARLVLTDKLIQEDLRRAKAAAEAANEQQG